MHSQQEHLIPAAAAAATELAGSARRTGQRRKQQHQQAGSWHKKTACKNSAASKSYSTRAINGNRLIENFSEFLATRNVINNTSNESSTSRHYDKLVSQPDDLSLRSSLNLREQRDSGRQEVQVVHTIKQTKKLNAKLSRFGKHGSSQHRTFLMLCALFSPSSKSDKRSILLNLIRAPTVLAALFSLMLAVTLIVLYALSFGHHSTTATTFDTFHPRVPVDPLSPNNKQQSRASGHRISSRDLPTVLEQQPEARASKQLNVDDDDDDDEDDTAELLLQDSDEEANELPEGLSRALSVQTECGLLMGSAEDSGVVFRGIPYASPPIGERRWQRPRPIWLDPRLCNSTGATSDESSGRTGARAKQGRQTRSRRRRRRKRRQCAQLNPITNRFAGQEDCLYLDVYLPRLDQTKRLPVMVYIHGGFLAFGSSSGQLNWMKARPSARLAAELEVIVVGFNYRLQALGFMTLPQSKSGPGASIPEQAGNFGLWDQLTALNWIKRNIESFGGDPNNIVLFGPDSASSLVWALIGNRQEADRSAEQSASGGIELRNLFRAAWLTNPTVFHDLPYELASQHYQRLFQNQSACLEQKKSSAQNSTSKQSTTRRDHLEDCLMQLSAEQVMRHYLGNDHPSYRLDDQNSLPIHGIFVDQFVTVDGELVRDSFPFRAAGGDSGATSSRPRCNATTTSSAALDSETNLPKSSSSLLRLQTSPPPSHNSSKFDETSHYPRGSSRGEQQTNEIAADYDGQASDCGHGDSLSERQNSGGPGTIELLIGSSAQAVEQWPCPRNLNQWSWDDFKRYVATSLNSFATDLYRRASSLYDVPKLSRNKANNDGQQQQHQQSSATPAWTYLTMVSDIRQICPINELTDNLRQLATRGQGLSVHRYIVESSPTMSTKEESGRTRPGARSSADSDHYAQPNYLQNGRPKLAYHTKDLGAFFGYEFDPTFRPQTGDLKFQTKIRQMVRQFVHKQGANTKDGPDEEHGKLMAVLDENGATRYVDRYRDTECSMWRRHLGKSYAWLS